MDFPIVLGSERADLVFALHEDGQRWRLHSADRGEVEAALLRIEGGHRARTVNAYQPIGLGAALGSVGQRQQFLIGAQLGKAVANRLGRHRLQPQALDRLLRMRVLHDRAEDQLAFASRVAGVDQRAHVFALHEAEQKIEPLLAFLEWCKCEVRRYYGQVLERPFAALDVVFLGHHELEQMPDGGRQDVAIALKVVALARKAAKRACDVGGDRRFLCDDEFLGHAAAKGRR